MGRALPLGEWHGRIDGNAALAIGLLAQQKRRFLSCFRNKGQNFQRWRWSRNLERKTMVFREQVDVARFADVGSGFEVAVQQCGLSLGPRSSFDEV